MSSYTFAAVLFAAVVLLGVAVVLLRRRPRTRLARISRHRAAPGRRWRWNGAGRGVRRFAVARPRLSLFLAGLAVAALGALLGGPVAAVIGGLYAMVAVRGWQSREARRAVERAYAAMLVAVDAAASDLRAGLVPDLLPIGRAAMSTVPARDAARSDAARPNFSRSNAPGPSSAGPGVARPDVARNGVVGPSTGRASVNMAMASVRYRRVAPAPDPVAVTDSAVAGALARLEAAYRISEALGTPLADLLDRVDADLRAQQRLRLTVQAQTAGAQATSVLLAGLPVVGLALGGAMGFDPVAQLLHTPVGGTCAVTAALLQCGGLAWTARLVRGATAGVR
jgi:tight adherence protein B